MVNGSFKLLRDGVLSCLGLTTGAGQSPPKPPRQSTNTESSYHTAWSDSEAITYHLGTTPKIKKDFPGVTISASTELTEPRELSSITVLNQQSYTSKKIAICSSSEYIPHHYIVRPISSQIASRSQTDLPLPVADAPCVALGVDGLLEGLNATLGTAYILDADLSSLLGYFIAKNDDFGTAYARLRRRWYGSWNSIREDLKEQKSRDQKVREEALVDKQIVNPNIPPRRVWDLYSNRVVPYWSIPHEQDIWAISHAWRDEEDRHDIDTPINGHEWPVPIPKDADLNLIRIEMLNLGAEYVWLDALCLRRRGGMRDDLCEEEWELDIRTVGYVFAEAKKVVFYFSGLGLPFRFSMEDFDHPRSWFKRAWLLQQFNRNFIIGGGTMDHASGEEEVLKSLEKNVRSRFSEELSALKTLHGSSASVFDVLRCMKDRVSTNAVDRVAGLAYLLRSQKLPPYYHATTEEEAWAMLVGTMDKTYRAQLLFLYPKPGNERKQSWRPSWRQIMTENHPSMDRIQLYDSDKFDRDGMDDIYNGYCIEQGYVEGLDATDSEGQLPNGKLTVKDIRGKEYTFDIAATHQVPIAAGSYTLIGSEPWSQKSAKPRDENSKQYWVVGKPRESGQEFEKVSVFQIADPGFMSRLDELGIAQRFRNILI